MNSTTKNALAITRLLGNRGCTVSSVTVHTPDGREWAIDIDSPMGFRLYEVDPNDRESAEEHHAIDDDTWNASDLIDYLKAVGEPRPGPIDPNPTGPTC